MGQVSALGLYSKACKQFRSIIILGEAGFGDEVAILTRSLFETALSIEFLMRGKVVLKREGNEVDIDSSRPLTTDFRAQLYFARAALTNEKRLKEWKARAELKDSMAIRGDPGVIVAQAAAAKTAVSEAWWKALSKGTAAAGLSVKNLADSLGLLSYYIMVYGDQSEVAHAGDGYCHFDVAEDGISGLLDMSPSSDGIGGRLRLACLVFLSCLTSVHNRLQFGSAAETSLNAFTSRLGVVSG